MSRNLFVGQFLNSYGDGHSRIRNVNFKEGGILPFSTFPFKGNVICAKKGKLLHEDYPYLHSINGVEVARLLEVSGAYFTPNASAQFKQSVKVGRLNRIGEILSILGKDKNMLRVKLRSEKGAIWEMDQPIAVEEYKRFEELTLIEKMQLLDELQNNDPFEVRQFEEIGYLKIESMKGLEDGLELPLSELEESEALIIDVRDNGGGRRDILLNLAPHFISNEQSFVVGNVARFRTNTPSKHKSLKDRYLYPLEDKIFDGAARNQLTSWMSNFMPNISLNDSLYSPNFYLYIKGHDSAKFSNIPTVILMNEGCYSATDIFLSTFKEIEGVTLIGTASGGGSGRAQKYQLDHSVVELQLSSIVSYQPNGELYDGVGVQPDIEVPPKSVSDILKETDSQLDFAIDFLKQELKKR
ncbi:MAG: S41 family peptidase [Bacteroidota bacterium]